MCRPLGRYEKDMQRFLWLLPDQVGPCKHFVAKKTKLNWISLISAAFLFIFIKVSLSTPYLCIICNYSRFVAAEDRAPQI